MGKFRWNILNYFSRIAELGVEEKNFKLRNRSTFQDQSDSPSSSVEFYKSCKLELASKFIPRDIICGRSLAESKICLKTEKILARLRKQPNFRSNNRTPSRDLKTKRRVGPWLPKAEKNGIELQISKKRNRTEATQSAEKKWLNLFLFASFSLYWKEARADFQFQREKRNFVFSHHFWVSLEIALSFFWLNRTAEKRLHFGDLSVAKNLFLCTVKNNGRKFIHSDVHVETCWASLNFRKSKAFFPCIVSEDFWSSVNFHKNICRFFFWKCLISFFLLRKNHL